MPTTDPNTVAIRGMSDSLGLPTVSGAGSAKIGLYFCRFFIEATGMLRETGIKAQKIAREIKT